MHVSPHRRRAETQAPSAFFFDFLFASVSPEKSGKDQIEKYEYDQPCEVGMGCSNGQRDICSSRLLGSRWEMLRDFGQAEEHMKF